MSNEPAYDTPPPCHPLLLQLAEAEQAEREALGFGALNPMCLTPRATPARAHKPLRLRVCLSYDGPPWLSLLTQCAWLRGGIIGERVVPQPT